MPMLLKIEGHRLPGPVWHSDDTHYDNVHVGIQVGKEPRELVRADSQTSSWWIPIEVVARAGGLDFRGPAVQGRPGARFVYLTWGDVAGDGSFTMFRRGQTHARGPRTTHRRRRRHPAGHRTRGPHRRVRRAAVRPAQGARN
jgi:hypothetical protein